MSRSRRPVTGLTLVAPQRPLRRSTRNTAPPRRMSRADPVEFLPRLGAVDVDVGAEAQRVDLVAPLLLEAAHRRQIDQRDQVFRLVHEMAVARAHQPRRLAQRRHLRAEERLDRRAAVARRRDRRRAIARCRCMTVSRSVSAIEMGLQLGEPVVEHQHQEQALLRPFRLVRIDRRARPRQREHAIERKRAAGLELDARQRLRAQALDRIAVDGLDDGHVRARALARGTPSEPARGRATVA